MDYGKKSAYQDEVECLMPVFFEPTVKIEWQNEAVRNTSWPVYFSYEDCSGPWLRCLLVA